MKKKWFILNVNEFSEEALKEISLKILSRKIRDNMREGLDFLKESCKKNLLSLMQKPFSHELDRVNNQINKQVRSIEDIESFLSIIDKLHSKLNLGRFDRFCVWLNGELDNEDNLLYPDENLTNLNFLNLTRKYESLLNEKEIDFVKLLAKTLPNHYHSAGESFNFELSTVTAIIFCYYNNCYLEQQKIDEECFYL